MKKRSFGYDEKAIREVLEEKVEIPNSVEQKMQQAYREIGVENTIPKTPSLDSSGSSRDTRNDGICWGICGESLLYKEGNRKWTQTIL